MAEPNTGKPKVGGKKLPKWAIPAGAVGVVLIVLMLKKKQAANAGSATEPGAEGLSNQSFIPVTGENVAGVGASGIGGFGGGESSSNDTLFAELLKSNKEDQVAQNQANQEFLRSLVGNLGTGGGAPATSAPEGTVAAPAPQTQPAAPPVAAPKPAKAPQPAAKCGVGAHADFPNGSPPDCWRVSRTKSGGGCECHGHQNGQLACQSGYAKPKKGQSPCHW